MGARARNPRHHVKCVTSTEKLDLELGESSVQRLASLEYTVAKEKTKTDEATGAPTNSHTRAMGNDWRGRYKTKLLRPQGSIKNQDPHVFNTQNPHKTLNSRAERFSGH